MVEGGGRGHQVSVFEEMGDSGTFQATSRSSRDPGGAGRRRRELWCPEIRLKAGGAEVSRAQGKLRKERLKMEETPLGKPSSAKQHVVAGVGNVTFVVQPFL